MRFGSMGLWMVNVSFDFRQRLIVAEIKWEQDNMSGTKKYVDFEFQI